MSKSKQMGWFGAIMVLLGYFIGFLSNRTVETIHPIYACHSITEDSPPNDCKFTRIDSERGVWHK